MNYISLLEQAIYSAMLAGAEILTVYTSKSFEIESKSDNSPITTADKKANQVIVDQLRKTNIPIISEEIKNEAYSTRQNWEYAWIIDPLDGTKEFIKRNDEFTVNIALIHNGKPIAGVIYAPVLDILYFSLCREAAYKITKASVSIEAFDYSQLKKQALKLPLTRKNKNYIIVASRSHFSQETESFIKTKELENEDVEIISIGSSLKLCLIAERKADIYPRFAPTCEWDIAAGNAIIIGAGGKVVDANSEKELTYNKENLLNPWFIAQI